MKRKSSKRSLIFPIICAVGALILLLVICETALDGGETAMLIVFAVCAVLPLPSVLFLKTDISRFLKLQIIFTVVSLIAYVWYFFTVLSLVLIFVGLFVFGIAVPFAVTLTCIIMYIPAAKREPDRKILKYFTALLSTPVIYSNIFLMTVCIAFCFFEGISGLAYIG